MKRSVCRLLVILSTVAGVGVPATALATGGCELSLVGTWKAESPGNPVFYRFGPDATVTMLSRAGSDQATALQAVGRGVYALDDARAPTTIRITAKKASGGFRKGTTSLVILAYDDTSVTFAGGRSGPTRWVRVETERHFLVLAGRSGTFYDLSGPVFSTLIKGAGPQAQVEAFGIYAAGNRPAFGPVPAGTVGELMKEPRSASDVMLRLEITGAQHERSLKILRTWDRRVREGALLYPDVFMDNILLVKQMTEELNRCGETITLYALDWGLEDDISENNRPPNIPFQYFKALRRLNESRHVRDDDVQPSRSN